MKTKEDVLWKQRFDILKTRTFEIVSQDELREIERCDKPHSVLPDLIYVSFNWDVISTTEKKAIEVFGKDNYDIFRLWKKSIKHDDEG